jgi:hypothetical protein
VIGFTAGLEELLYAIVITIELCVFVYGVMIGELIFQIYRRFKHK